ncbi:MAG: VWA domain-containing protein [Vicinamibacteria bacterium]|nr:VWA domain-containing protein [Vicinamibacteria bacterium]
MILWPFALLGLLQPPMGTYSLQAVVSDSKGVPLRDLEAADVSLTAGGQTVFLDRFERDERPSRVALLVDSSMPMATPYRASFIDAASAFVASLPSNTRVTVWTTGDRPAKVLDDLDLNLDHSARELVNRLSRVPTSGGNTILDAVVEASEDLVKKEGERKIVVFLSGTGPGFSSADRQSIVDRVLKTGVEVAGVLASERGESEGGGEVSQADYDFVFGQLTERTGGRLERPLTTMGASSVFARVAADLRSTYRLSFDFSGAKIPRLALQVARPRVKVRLSTPRKETSSP